MKPRVLALVILLGIGAIAVGWIYESRLRQQIDRTELVIPDNIDYFLTNLRYRVLNRDGAIDFEFNSPRLEHYRRDDISSIEIPSLKIYRDADHWQVDSRIGEFEHRLNLLRLRQQVVMQKQGDNPMRLYTESIRFEPERDRVSSEAEVTMLSDRLRIEAERAVFDLAAKVYRFSKIHAIYNNDGS